MPQFHHSPSANFHPSTAPPAVHRELEFGGFAGSRLGDVARRHANYLRWLGSATDDTDLAADIAAVLRWSATSSSRGAR